MPILQRLTDSELFKIKLRFSDNTNIDGIINTKITVLLIYFSNFRRALEMPLINCENNLILSQSENCLILEGNSNNLRNNRYKPYVPVVNLSTQNNTKLLQELKSGFKCTINQPELNIWLSIFIYVSSFWCMIS